MKDRKEFDLKIRLYHGYKSKGNPETGTFDPFYKPSGILIQRGTWDINLNIPVVVFWSREETVGVDEDTNPKGVEEDGLDEKVIVPYIQLWEPSILHGKKRLKSL